LREKGDRDLREGREGRVEEVDVDGGSISDSSGKEALLSSGLENAVPKAVEGVAEGSAALNLVLSPLIRSLQERVGVVGELGLSLLLEGSPNHSSLALLLGPLSLPPKSRAPDRLPVIPIESLES